MHERVELVTNDFQKLSSSRCPRRLPGCTLKINGELDSLSSSKSSDRRTIKQATKAGEARNAEDSSILDQCCWTGTSRQQLTLLQRGAANTCCTSSRCHLAERGSRRLNYDQLWYESLAKIVFEQSVEAILYITIGRSVETVELNIVKEI